MAVPARADFLLDPDLVFLNNGSFGAVPRVVQQAYEELQREMERNPVAWLARRAPELLATARADVGRYVGAEADDLVFFPNPTTAINMVARSLQLEPGDEVVSTDERMWNGQPFIRLSFAAYNTEADSEAVVTALQVVLH